MGKIGKSQCHKPWKEGGYKAESGCREVLTQKKGFGACVCGEGMVVRQEAVQKVRTCFGKFGGRETT